MMATYNTPLSSGDASFERVIGQNLPVLLYLFRHTDSALDSMLKDTAYQQAGKFLVVRVDAAQNPQIMSRFHHPAVPALLSLKNGAIMAQTNAPLTPADVKSHAAYLIGQGKKPAAALKPIAPIKPGKVTDGSFTKDVLQSDIPVLVDFWASWCPPCRTIAPILDTLARKYSGKVKILKLDVDANPVLPARYQTRSIPTMILFHRGKEKNRLVGAHPQAAIEKLIQSALK